MKDKNITPCAVINWVVFSGIINDSRFYNCNYILPRLFKVQFSRPELYEDVESTENYLTYLHKFFLELIRNMMTSWNGNIFRVTGPLCGEFAGHRWIPHTKASDAELWCFLWRLNKRLSKQLWGRWFETQSRPLYRHCNDVTIPL